MVPPVLSKSSRVEQPVLRLVWSHAFASLATAHEVTFIGYSFPTTDMAARTLFSEALKDLPPQDINVVILCRDVQRPRPYGDDTEQFLATYLTKSSTSKAR